MTERFIEANGVELCAEAFGDPSDPAILDRAEWDVLVRAILVHADPRGGPQPL